MPRLDGANRSRGEAAASALSGVLTSSGGTTVSRPFAMFTSGTQAAVNGITNEAASSRAISRLTPAP
jgi:hypothetical protein